MPEIPPVLAPWVEVIHPAALILPRLGEAEYNELKESIAKAGLLQPLGIFIDERGEHWLVDGVSRLMCLIELKSQPILDAEGRWALNTTNYYEAEGADPYELALSLNVTRRQLTIEQKRDVIRALREERPDLSDRAIGRMAHVSPTTVAAVRAEEEASAPNGEYEEGAIGEPGEAPPEAEAKAPEPERREESGRRARGRQRGEQRREAPPPRHGRGKRRDAAAGRERGQGGRRARAESPRGENVTELAKPFVGTVLPTAPKAARVAEGRRCLRYLGLTVDDVARHARASA